MKMQLDEAKQILNDSGYILTEYHSTEYDEIDTNKCPIIINKFDFKYNKEYNKYLDIEYIYCLGLTDEEKKQIETILPGFIEAFDVDFIYSGGDSLNVDINVRHYGESDSWDGRDFGTYDPGWGETEIDSDVNDLVDEVNSAIEEALIHYWAGEVLQEQKEYMKFNGTDEEWKEKIKEIYNIIINRSGKDIIE